MTNKHTLYLLLITICLLLQACGPSDNEVAIAQANSAAAQAASAAQVAAANSNANIARANSDATVARYAKESQDSALFWANIGDLTSLTIFGILTIIVAIYVGRITIAYLKHKIRVEEYQVIGYLPPPPSRPRLPPITPIRIEAPAWPTRPALVDSYTTPAPRRRYTNEELKRLEDRRLAIFQDDAQ